MEVQDQGACIVKVWWKLSSELQTIVFFLCSHIEEQDCELCESYLFYEQ